MKKRYYGTFSFFVSLLMAIFIIWENDFSKGVILIGVGLIMAAAIFEIIFDKSYELPHDSHEADREVLEVEGKNMSKKDMKKSLPKIPVPESM